MKQNHGSTTLNFYLTFYLIQIKYTIDMHFFGEDIFVDFPYETFGTVVTVVHQLVHEHNGLVLIGLASLNLCR